METVFYTHPCIEAQIERIGGVIINGDAGETITRVPTTNIAVLHVKDARHTVELMLSDGWEEEDFLR